MKPAEIAVTEDQRKSISELSLIRRYSLFESVTEDDRENYFKTSCRPITKKAENDMELLSDIVTWGEKYLHHWDIGIYKCSRCLTPLYSSKDKYVGPCVWPSFRKPVELDSLSTTEVIGYNNYKVTVKEVYCGKCDLFIGHQFADAKEKGDTYIHALWRH